MTASATFPLDFRFVDSQDNFLLTIADDPTDQNVMRLQITNVSGQDMDFFGPPDQIDKDDCSFELRFRRGLLADKTLHLLQDPAGPALSPQDRQTWQIVVDQPEHADYDSLCFQTKQMTSFPAGTKVDLLLHNIAANALGGARGTRVVLNPHRVRYTPLPNSNWDYVVGVREQYLYVANHSGLKRIPLHVGFSGSNRVLCNPAGTANNLSNSLSIEIRNIATPAMDLNDAGIVFKSAQVVQGVKHPASGITVSFDIGPSDGNPWALGTQDDMRTVKLVDAGAINAGTPSAWDIRPDPDQQAGTVSFVAEPSAGDVILHRGDSLLFRISDLYSSLSPGAANIYVRYRDIQGFWDGYFVLPVEKSILGFYDNQVAIGTNQPKGRLAIKGVTAAAGSDSLYISDAQDQPLLVVGDDGHLGIGAEPNADAHVAINTAAADVSHAALTVTNPDGKPTVRIWPNGSAMLGPVGGASDVMVMVNGNMMVADQAFHVMNGHVGIGQAYSNFYLLSVGSGPTYLGGDLYVAGRIFSRINMGSPGPWYNVIADSNIGNLTRLLLGTDPSGAVSPNPIPSDLRLKTDLQPISSALDKVRRLRGLAFRWNERALDLFTRDIESTYSAGGEATDEQHRQVWDEVRKQRIQEVDGPHLGVVAQDVEAVLPEAVSENGDGYKAVDYRSLIPLLIEAVKEQAAQIDELRGRLAAIEAQA